MAHVFYNGASPLSEKMPFWLPKEICMMISVRTEQPMCVDILIEMDLEASGREIDRLVVLEAVVSDHLEVRVAQ